MSVSDRNATMHVANSGYTRQTSAAWQAITAGKYLGEHINPYWRPEQTDFADCPFRHDTNTYCVTCHHRRENLHHAEIRMLPR